MQIKLQLILNIDSLAKSHKLNVELISSIYTFYKIFITVET